MIAGTTKTLGNRLTWHPLPLSHDPGRHSLSALFALLGGSLKFSCTSGWEKRHEQAAYGSCTLAALQQGTHCSHISLCCLPCSLPPLPTYCFACCKSFAHRSEGQRSLLTPPPNPRNCLVFFNFRNLCLHHLPPWKLLHTPFRGAKPDSFLLYSNARAGRPWASTFACVISAHWASIYLLIWGCLTWK